MGYIDVVGDRNTSITTPIRAKVRGCGTGGGGGGSDTGVEPNATGALLVVLYHASIKTQPSTHLNLHGLIPLLIVSLLTTFRNPF